MKFTYPVFSKPHTAQEAVAWLHNAALSQFAAHRDAWRHIGIMAVYQSALFRFSRPRSDGYLMGSVLL